MSSEQKDFRVEVRDPSSSEAVWLVYSRPVTGVDALLIVHDLRQVSPHMDWAIGSLEGVHSEEFLASTLSGRISHDRDIRDPFVLELP